MRINVVEYLTQSARLYKDKIAIKDSKKQLTFSQIEMQAKVLACYIISQKIYNKPIAVYMPKSCEMVVSFAAINYSGNFYVPLDTKSPDSRLLSILNVLDSQMVITTKEYYEKLSIFCTCPIICIDDIISSSFINQQSIDKVQQTIIDTDPIYSIFTSGSTGTPKGVVVSHRGVIDYIEWAIRTFNIQHDTVIGNQAPFYFDNSTLDLYLMFAAGATLMIVPEEYYVFPAKLIDYLNENRVNFIFWVPFALINVANFKLLEEKPLLYMKKVLFAGEVMPNKHLNYWRKYMPDCLYANLYGPTEITVDCTYYIVDRQFSDDESLPIGKPCRNSGILILNDQNKVVQVAEQGELCVRGSSLALGYYNDPEKTIAAFVQNPLNNNYSEIIYRTGDLVYRNERDEIIYVGRKDSQIKHNGYRIELGEIETAVLSTGLVELAGVLYDNIHKQIVMFYQGSSDINLGQLRGDLQRFIPKYMIPTKFFRLERLPINANGKIDRLKLKEQLNG